MSSENEPPLALASAERLAVVQKLWHEAAEALNATTPDMPGHTVAQSRYVITTLARLDWALDVAGTARPISFADHARLNEIFANGLKEAADRLQGEVTTHISMNEKGWFEYVERRVLPTVICMDVQPNDYLQLAMQLADGRAFIAE